MIWRIVFYKVYGISTKINNNNIICVELKYKNYIIFILKIHQKIHQNTPKNEQWKYEFWFGYRIIDE